MVGYIFWYDLLQENNQKNVLINSLQATGSYGLSRQQVYCICHYSSNGWKISFGKRSCVTMIYFHNVQTMQKPIRLYVSLSDVYTSSKYHFTKKVLLKIVLTTYVSSQLSQNIAQILLERQQFNLLTTKCRWTKWKKMPHHTTLPHQRFSTARLHSNEKKLYLTIVALIDFCTIPWGCRKISSDHLPFRTFLCALLFSTSTTDFFSNHDDLSLCKNSYVEPFPNLILKKLLFFLRIRN